MTLKKGLSNLVLLSLEKTVDGFLRIEDFGRFGHLYGYERPLKKSSLSKALKRLRENNLIKLVDEEKLIYKITKKGKKQALISALKQSNEKWDGKWRIVIFDIPEKRRAARDLLRQKLKEWGFIHWQKSVWASKKNCTKVLRNFITQVGIDDWVMVIESSNIGR
jgi:DNA-binding transcriptional regulator PaaX